MSHLNDAKIAATTFWNAESFTGCTLTTLNLAANHHPVMGKRLSCLVVERD